MGCLSFISGGLTEGRTWLGTDHREAGAHWYSNADVAVVINHLAQGGAGVRRFAELLLQFAKVDHFRCGLPIEAKTTVLLRRLRPAVHTASTSLTSPQ
jgi:hypothetical protein